MDADESKARLETARNLVRDALSLVRSVRDDSTHGAILHDAEAMLDTTYEDLESIIRIVESK